jgi:hypothetical protein
MTGAVTVTPSTVVNLVLVVVCANTGDAMSAQARAIIVFLTMIPPPVNSDTQCS